MGNTPGVLHDSILLECSMAPQGDSAWPPQIQTLFADVLVPRHIAKTFTYIVPFSLAHCIQTGSIVKVPFGRSVLEGVVVSISSRLAPEMTPASLKTILALVENRHNSTISPTLLELSHKIARYYVAPWGQCLRLLSPPAPVSSTRYLATELGRTALETGTCPDSLRPTLQRIARRSSGILSSTLQPTQRGHALRAVDTLIERSWVNRVPSNTGRIQAHKRQRILLTKPEKQQALPHAEVDTDQLPKIDPAWCAHLHQCFQANQTKKIVLQAPWQHRITRLAEAIRQAHSHKRSTIVVCGETAKARWLTHILAPLTGLQIVLAQPPSSPQPWDHHRGQTPSVIVGTRSAVFVQLDSVGLIWVEGEEDSALKEPKEPRYHAREVACLRAKEDRALVVLASEHPSLESHFDTAAEIHRVPQDRTLQPKIELVDLNKESSGTLLSQSLRSAMHEALEGKQRILLFLNRRGYAGTLICRDCGWVPRCPSCTVALPYYREAANLTCRYCGFAEGLPDVCPLCHATSVRPLGEGTEQVEAEAHRLFPHTTIARLDSDTLHRPATARSLWERARSGSCDILIGTQALFTHEPLPQHHVVGILQADSGLHVSDFRAAERTYHLLVDAASLAHPASSGGRVILQTRLPSHHAVQALLSGNSHQFYDEELTARRLLNYPPVCHIADLTVTGPNRTFVEEAATRWGADLQQQAAADEQVVVLGPVPTLGRRTQGQHHRRLLVKATNPDCLARRIRDSVENMERQYRQRQVKFVVDMDPVENG
jgi:primosomal protein N' (replication factor Y) (superfamily II helicase)